MLAGVPHPYVLQRCSTHCYCPGNRGKTLLLMTVDSLDFQQLFTQEGRLGTWEMEVCIKRWHQIFHKLLVSTHFTMPEKFQVSWLKFYISVIIISNYFNTSYALRQLISIIVEQNSHSNNLPTTVEPLVTAAVQWYGCHWTDISIHLTDKLKNRCIQEAENFCYYGIYFTTWE